MSYENNAYSVSGTEKSSNPEKLVFRQDSPETLPSKPSHRHIILISIVVCVVTAGIVCGIAIPVTKSNTESKCDCGDKNAPSTTCMPQPTNKIPPTTAPVTPEQHTGPLRDPMADTFYGPVLGHEVDMGTGDQYDNVMSYLGIRYAAPPERWEKPREPDQFTETYEASTLQATCIQHTKLLHFTQPYWEDISEDCLFMNIYSPMDNGTKYPVMLWFHGGAYQDGGNIQYPGHSLAQKGVVVVVINYRLNIFGFASTGDGTLKGNYGLWDQRQAMLYVQTTIDAFGGDPTRLTISGQSAGAASTGLHLVSPETKGLFQQALFESGNYVTFWAINSPVDQPETYLPQVAQDVGCPTQNTTEMVDCLKTMNASVLLNATFQCPFCLGFTPVIDGEYIPEYPLNIALNGGLHDVPILTGVNTGECSLFMMGLEPFTILQDNGFNRTVFQQLIAFAVDYFYFIVTETDVQPNDFYRLLNWYYTPWSDIHNETANKFQISRMCSDGAFVAANAETVKLQAENATVYMYVNGIMPVPYFPPIPDWLKASIPHEFEIPYVWGFPSVYYGTESYQMDTGNLSVPLICWSEQDYMVGQPWFQTLWTNFIKYGNPTPTPVDSVPGQPQVTWDMYDNTNYSYLLMGNQITENQREYRLQEATLYTDYILYLARGMMLDNIDPYMMGPLVRTEWLDPTVAEALGVTMETQNFRKKRSLPDEKPGHAPLSAEARSINPAVKELVINLLTPLIEKINTTAVDNFNMTVNDLVNELKDNWPAIQESKCYNAVVPYAIHVANEHKAEIIAKIREVAQKRGITTPKLL